MQLPGGVRTTRNGRDKRHSAYLHTDRLDSPSARGSTSATSARARRPRAIPRGARGPRREVIGKDRRGSAKHDDASTLVIRGDEQAPAQSRFEILEELAVLLRRLEIAPVQDEPCGPGVTEEADVRIGELGAGQPEYQLLSDEGLEIGHNAIIGCGPLADLDLRKFVLSGG